MQHADHCLCPTETLALHARIWNMSASVVPNGFDEAALALARRVMRARRTCGRDGVLRTGYAGGSHTHQRDFAVAAPALAQVLRARPDCRLVLFRPPGDHQRPIINVDAFPDLAACAAQIEWRDMVAPEQLPAEVARFDTNLARLEVGNPFCEAKNELKYFEAALVEVPTIASPTEPFRNAIVDGVTGFLAESTSDWQAVLLRLVDFAALRRRIGRAAYRGVLWRYGPRRRVDAVTALWRETEGAQHAALALSRSIAEAARKRTLPNVPETEILFEQDGLADAEVTVTIAAYNYGQSMVEALESVRAQTLGMLDLVVIDDGSTDDSIAVALDWLNLHAGRFNRVSVRRTLVNSGLGGNRNAGFDAAETPFMLPLDADNRLLPECCEKLLAALKDGRAAFAYPEIQQFGAMDGVLSRGPFAPMRLAGGNYIDAMAMVAKWAWAGAGGCYVREDAMGWEDYDLWLGLVDLGQWGVPVAEVLAEYRVHPNSMVNAITEQDANKRRMVELVEQRHPWLHLLAREAVQRV